MNLNVSSQVSLEAETQTQQRRFPPRSECSPPTPTTTHLSGELVAAVGTLELPLAFVAPQVDAQLLPGWRHRRGQRCERRQQAGPTWRDEDGTAGGGDL